MKCRSYYKDPEKYRKYRNGYNRRYYQKRQHYTKKLIPWSEMEIEMIMEHKESDTEMAIKLGRSVRAIQDKRHKLKKERERYEASVLYEDFSRG